MIIATAGHVDHGKTSLVKALTGIDTDRLPEEKKRGLTIDIGFAYLKLAADVTIGFIDVPGHERFVHNMLCGVAGVDAALFIVAADDGPMPQTLEHLAILDLLGVRRGLVALTKIDRVPAARVDEVRAEIAHLFAPTTLADAEVFAVSAITGAGIEALRARLEALARSTAQRAASGNFRLAVDRTFTVPGAGLIATGTAVAGQVAVGEQVRALLAGQGARIRGIHAQNAPAQVGRAGERCALNLASTQLDVEQLRRGDWIVHPDAAPAVPKFDAQLRVLASEAKPLQHWTPVHLHLGASDVTARLAVLEGTSIAPGATALVQLVLDHPIGAAHGDRFIVRDQSARRTLGGGSVLDIHPPRRGRAKPERLAQLRAQENTDPTQALAALLRLSPLGLSFTQFTANRNLSVAERNALLAATTHRLIDLADRQVVFEREQWQAFGAAAIEAAGAHHRRFPEQAGMPDDQLLRASHASLPREVAVAIAAELIRDNTLARTGAVVHLPDHRPKVNAAEAALWEKILRAIEATPQRPPTSHEIAVSLRADLKKVQSMLERAARQGILHRVSDARFYTPAALQQLAALAAELAAKDGDRKLTVAAFRDKSALGRNVTIEVLEFFDRVRFTRRAGEAREVLRSPVGLFMRDDIRDDHRPK